MQTDTPTSVQRTLPGCTPAITDAAAMSCRSSSRHDMCETSSRRNVLHCHTWRRVPCRPAAIPHSKPLGNPRQRVPPLGHIKFAQQFGPRVVQVIFVVVQRGVVDFGKTEAILAHDLVGFDDLDLWMPGLQLSQEA